MRIAFLGLGTMGAPMAGNLLAAGHSLIVWNRSPERATALLAAGAVLAESPRAAAASADLVLTMLADERALGVVLHGEQGVLQGLQPGSLLVDMSTIGRHAALATAALVQARGAHFIDAPVSGTRGPAIARKLIVLCGGDAADIARVRPVLEALGSVRHVGGVGDGAAVKLVLNALGAQMLIAFASSLALAKRLHLDSTQLVGTIQAGPFASPLFDLKSARLLSDDPGKDADFTVDLWEKDQRLVLEEAARLGLDMPTVETVRTLMKTAVNAGYGSEDIAVIAKLWSQ